MDTKRCVPGVLLAVALASPAWAGRALTIDDLLAVQSVADPQVSPDGKRVVYVVSELDRSTNKSNSDLWLIPIDGGEPRRLTTAPGADNHPRWSPDGKKIAFVSDRGGSSQVWLLPIDGGEARQLTKLPIDVAGPIWSPKGDQLAFAAEVYPGKTPEETAARDKEKAEAKSKVRIYDRLMIRHWMGWDEGKRNHLFLADAETGAAKDLTPNLKVNAPPAPFGGSSDYDFAPDGQELAFTAEPIKDMAWSTNTDIWTVPLDGGEPKNRTEENKGADAQPAYSPDGKAIAFVRQKRPGFESDRWELTILHRETGRSIPMSFPGFSREFDRSIGSFAWADGGTTFYAIVDDRGEQAIYEFHRIDGEPAYRGLEEESGRIAVPENRRLVKGGTNTGLHVVPKADGPAFSSPDSPALVFVLGDAAHPGEVYRAESDGSGLARLTHHNDAWREPLDLAPAERFTFKGAEGDEVSGWLVRPPGFDDAKRYPVVFLIHGGPQGAWHDEWHGRWNYAMFAAKGYAVVAINPRGSTGYGQKFTDQISGDWNGRVYEDLMKGLDHALKTYTFLDGDRVAAAGGSYGGYMVNWIAGHNDRFKALISHAGVFDLASMYGTTEELWFPEWEFGGPPWEKSEVYRSMSPSTYVENFKTPTLVIHGALDYRVPDAQGLGMFTSLQRRGVPSRFVYFPDEGHWIQKVPNRIVWWREIHDWLGKYLKPQ